MNPLDERVTNWLNAFGSALETKDALTVSEMFVDDCYWRDLVSFTWNIRTMEGKEQIQDMLNAMLDHVQPRKWRMVGSAKNVDGVIDAWISFETEVARGYGHIRLMDGNDKCWTLLTTMKELKGHEERKAATRPKGVEHGFCKDRKSWLDYKQQEEAEMGYSKQPYCVIVGGGQGGIVLGARLKQLDVPTIILEKKQKAGDTWRNRYRSLCLHDPVWYDHLPYIPFPDHWPVFAPRDKFADWLEMYTKVMDLNYWTNALCTKASFDETKGVWEVHVTREGQPVVLRPTQLVLAAGNLGIPNVPEFPGADCFQGEIHHTSAHGDSAAFKGKQCIVVGSSNSAHDISLALYEQGADVTMLQRSSTHISRSDTLMELAMGDLYSERAVASGIDTDTADLIFASVPYKIMPTFHIPVYQEMARRDAEFYSKLEQAGFLLDWGDDNSGLFMKYLRSASGFCIDVGAGQLIIDGHVKLRSKVNIQQIKEKSVVLCDGSELPADVIILATGYRSMNGLTAQLISQDVADKVGKVWGLGSDTTKDPGPWEGEERNMWKPTQQPNLWFHGGNLHHTRHYSQFLALQLKAREAGILTPIYGLQEVHHLS